MWLTEEGSPYRQTEIAFENCSNRVYNGLITVLAWHPTRPVLANASEVLVTRLWTLNEDTRLASGSRAHSHNLRHGSER